MRKRLIAAGLLLVMCMSLGMGAALADEVGEEREQRVTMGANLDAEQRKNIYKDFGIEEGEIKELKVTNAEEREYLEGLVPDRKIGSVALSCSFITMLDDGKGLDVTTNNINWCTKEMYTNALITAGIYDAKVMVSAPFAVSGTAALTGIYKAYEDITGKKLDENAKNAGAEELITTGELGEVIGKEEAAKLVNELKKILDQLKNMTDDQVRAEIRRIADGLNIELTDEQVEKLLSLCRSLQNLDLDVLKDKLFSLTDALNNASKVGDFFTGLAEGIKNFFASIGDFFTRLFGGGK